MDVTVMTLSSAATHLQRTASSVLIWSFNQDNQCAVEKSEIHRVTLKYLAADGVEPEQFRRLNRRWRKMLVFERASPLGDGVAAVVSEPQYAGYRPKLLP